MIFVKWIRDLWDEEIGKIHYWYASRSLRSTFTSWISRVLNSRGSWDLEERRRYLVHLTAATVRSLARSLELSEKKKCLVMVQGIIQHTAAIDDGGRAFSGNYVAWLECEMKFPLTCGSHPENLTYLRK